VVRLVIGARGTIGVDTADGVRAIVGVRECTVDGSGVPLEWLARCSQ
jgi:hypothetical protein